MPPTTCPMPMSYCTVADVCSEFPRFVRAQEGSVSDAQILAWLEQYAARIDSALAERGILPGQMTLTSAQSAWLEALNQDAGVGKLGLTLQGNVTMQPGEYSLAAGRLRSYERTLAGIKDGTYDAFWGVGTSSKFGGVAGAEVPKEDTPEALEENRSFGKDQDF